MRNSEIQNLWTTLGQEHVRGLEIAMNHPALVRRCNGIRNGRNEINSITHLEPSVREAGREIFSIEPLHGKPDLAFGPSLGDEANDARVLERTKNRSLTNEALLLAWIGGHHFERNLAFGLEIDGAPDLAHPTFRMLGGQSKSSGKGLFGSEHER